MEKTSVQFTDLIDIDVVSDLLTHFYRITGLPVTIVNSDNVVLFSIGGVEVCKKFHQPNPEIAKACNQCNPALPSHKHLKDDYYESICLMGLNSIAYPVLLDNRHFSTIYLGRFFYAGDPIDLAVYKKAAARYKFNEVEYLNAISEVPRYTREQVLQVMAFYKTLAGMLSAQGYYNLALFREITEKRKIDDLLENTLREYKFLTENISDVIWTMDMNLKFTHISKSSERLFGYSMDERKNISLEQLITPASYQYIMNTFRDFIQRAKKGERITGPVILELQAIHKSGNNFWIEVSVTPVYNPDGAMVALQGVTRDITSRRAIQQKLIESERFFRQLTESIHDLVALVDKLGFFFYISPNFTAITGYSADQIIGKSAFFFIHPEDRGRIFKIFMANIQQNYSTDKAEYRFKNANGEYAWHETLGKTWYDEHGRVAGAIVTARDITEKKLAMEKERKQFMLTDILKQSASDLVLFPEDKSIYQYIAEKLQLIVPDSIIVVNSVNTVERYAQTQYIAGLGPFASQMINLIGANPVGKTYKINTDDFFILTDGNIIKFDQGGLYELSFHQIPQPVCLAIEKLLRLKNIFVVGFVYNRILYGTAVIIVRQGNPDIPSDAVNTFTRQVSQYLHKQAIQHEMANYTSNLEILYNLSGELWHIDKDINLFDLFAAKIHQIIDHSIVAITSYNPLTRKSTLESLEGLSDSMWKGLTEVLNFEFIGAEFDTTMIQRNTALWYAMISDTFVLLPGGADNLSLGKFNHAAIVAAKKLFNISEIYIAGLYWGNILKGNIWMVMLDNHKPVNLKLVESIIRQMGVIMQRREAERAVIESEEKFRMTFMTIPDAAALVRKSDKVFIEVNDGFVNLTGYPVNELTGQNISMIRNAGGNDSFFGFLDNMTPGNRVTNIERYGLNQKGEVFVALVSVRSVQLQGDDYYLFLAKDIREIKQIEQDLIKAKEKAQESDRLKSAFLANMSHEIRTPMNGIMGFSELLQKTSVTFEKQQLYIKYIFNCSRQLLGIINDIIDISKIEAGQLVIYETPVLLNDICDEVMSMAIAEREIVGSKVDIRNTTAADVLLTQVFLDTGRIKQLLMNLINNALKFTYKGTIELNIQIKDGLIEFCVSDTGIGIEESKQHIIFDRFKQAEDGISRKYGGTGLGLAICRKLVEMMGGRIWVISHLNVGSQFFFTVPFKPVGERKSILPETAVSHKYDWKARKILIVEDDVTSYLYLQSIIEPTGASIIHAAEAKSAIDYCRTIPDISLVLMDVQLPGMSGLEATKQIKQLRKELPVIVQTAFAMQGDRLKSLEAGGDEYLAKPISSDLLLATINRFFLRTGQ